MENPWRQRWQEGRIGFHLSDTHRRLSSTGLRLM